jgi:hypothetical protein
MQASSVCENVNTTLHFKFLLNIETIIKKAKVKVGNRLNHLNVPGDAFMSAVEVCLL